MSIPQTNKKPRSRTGERLRQRGFDESLYCRRTGTWWVRCSQCQALVINGVPVHERGCPNERRDYEED